MACGQNRTRVQFGADTAPYKRGGSKSGNEIELLQALALVRTLHFDGDGFSQIKPAVSGHNFSESSKKTIQMILPCHHRFVVGDNGRSLQKVHVFPPLQGGRREHDSPLPN
jgi:hypothetical protein